MFKTAILTLFLILITAAPRNLHTDYILRDKNSKAFTHTHKYAYILWTLYIQIGLIQSKCQHSTNINIGLLDKLAMIIIFKAHSYD